MSNNKSSEADIWRNGYNFALLLLVILGITLVVLGAMAFPQGTVPNVILVGTGIAMAPGALVAALFRVFLFREIQYQLTHPIINEVKERLGPELRAQVTSWIEKYRAEISTLEALKEAGMLRPYRSREVALKEFASAIDAETSEIMVIGSSLKGLLQKYSYREIREKLRSKISNNVSVKFLLTHPVVADLRAGQEARQFTDIGREIIASLRILQKWNVPPEDVRLYKGTPTVFAIKTTSKMFLNPYPYCAVAYDSPCIIVESIPNRYSYFYDAFDAFHFGAWDTNAVEYIEDYDTTIRKLEKNLETYAKTISQMLQQ